MHIKMKISFYLDCRRVDENSLAPLKLKIFHNKSTVMISLGISIYKNQFNSITEKIEHHPNKVMLNNYITRIRLDCEQVILNMGNKILSKLTAIQLKSELLKILGLEESIDESLFTVQFNNFISTKIKESTLRTYKFTIQKLREFSKNIDSLTFEDINLDFLISFNNYLIRSNMKQNSRNIYLRNIRAVFNYAIDNGVTTFYPFRKFKIKRQQTPKRSLTVEELRQFIDFKCEDYLVQYKDMFLLTFFLIGINTIDLLNLRKIINGRIEYNRSKTERHYSIKVEPEALFIINKYKGDNFLLNIMDRYKNYQDYQKRLNNSLKKIGNTKILEHGKKVLNPLFPDISVYWARHTWATIASSIDIPKDVIAHALGHGTNIVTDIYIDFDMKKVDLANRKVIDYVFYGRL